MQVLALKKVFMNFICFTEYSNLEYLRKADLFHSHILSLCFLFFPWGRLTACAGMSGTQSFRGWTKIIRTVSMFKNDRITPNVDLALSMVVEWVGTLHFLLLYNQKYRDSPVFFSISASWVAFSCRFSWVPWNCS